MCRCANGCGAFSRSRKRGQALAAGRTWLRSRASIAVPFSVVPIIAAYNEEDIIGQVVRELIREGVSVYLIDNGSTDGTAAEVERYRGAGVIGIERFPSEGSTAGHVEQAYDWEGLLRR